MLWMETGGRCGGNGRADAFSGAAGAGGPAAGGRRPRGGRPVLAVALALVAALGYGSSDFTAGLASRGADVLRVALLAQAASAVIVLAAVAAVLPWPHAPAPSAGALVWGAASGLGEAAGALALYAGFQRDRKSTRLNSSHPSISYAVFCLKKKN